MAAVNSRKYRRVDATFTRPNNTTPYASGDLVADTVTAGSVTPLSWVSVGNKPFIIPSIRLHKSGASPTNAQFRMNLFTSAPTVETTGDNGVLASNVNGSANWLASFEGTLDGFKDGCAGLLVPWAGVIKSDYNGVPSTIYGLLEARAAYTPGALEVFTAWLVQEFDQ